MSLGFDLFFFGFSIGFDTFWMVFVPLILICTAMVMV